VSKRMRLYPTGMRCPLCGDEYKHRDVNVAVESKLGRLDRMAYAHEPEWFSLNQHVTTERALHGVPTHLACAEKRMPEGYANWQAKVAEMRAQMEAFK
jgi:hypothetical protein